MMSEAEDYGGTRAFKHDIKNQLSNITLALEQLRFELPADNEDYQFYIETISTSCVRINNLVNDL